MEGYLARNICDRARKITEACKVIDEHHVNLTVGEFEYWVSLSEFQLMVLRSEVKQFLILKNKRLLLQNVPIPVINQTVNNPHIPIVSSNNVPVNVLVNAPAPAPVNAPVKAPVNAPVPITTSNTPPTINVSIV